MEGALNGVLLRFAAGQGSRRDLVRTPFSILDLGTGGPERQPRECSVVLSKKRTVTVTKDSEATSNCPIQDPGSVEDERPGLVTAGNRSYPCGLSALCCGRFNVPETVTSLPSLPVLSPPLSSVLPDVTASSSPSPCLYARMTLGEPGVPGRCCRSEVSPLPGLRSNCRQAL